MLKSHIPNQQKYVYHYSTDRYKQIKSLNQQNRRIVNSNIKDMETYRSTVSAFLDPIPYVMIRKYVKAGFKNWDMNPIYEHKINLEDNIKSFVKPIHLESTTDVYIDFRWGVWKDHIAKHNIDMYKMYNDVSYWKSVEIEYIKLVKKDFRRLSRIYLEDTFGKLDVVTYIKSKKVTEIRDSWKDHLDYNLEHGNHRQYATYIPHIYTQIEEPLDVESVIKLGG